MKKSKWFALSLVLAVTFSLSSDAYFEFCPNSSAAQSIAANYFGSIVPFDLLKYSDTETSLVRAGQKNGDASFTIINRTIDSLQANGKILASLGTSDIKQELNDQTLRLLEGYHPDDPTDRRLDFLNEDIVLALLKSIEKHPIVSSYGMRQYDQKGTNIGYCFGRAAYMELLLLRLGVDQNSIKKIWAVGPMSSGNISWQFHVATMVRLKDNRWVTIDNVTGKILEARDWFNVFKLENSSHDLRAFVTDGNKFTPSLGKYTRAQLGLDLLPTNDWYKGYFTDLMHWFGKMDDAKLAAFLGLSKLPERPLSAAALVLLATAQDAKNKTLIPAEEGGR